MVRTEWFRSKVGDFISISDASEFDPAVLGIESSGEGGVKGTQFEFDLGIAFEISSVHLVQAFLLKRVISWSQSSANRCFVPVFIGQSGYSADPN